MSNKQILWNEEKNQLLKLQRGINFDDVLNQIELGKILGRKIHPYENSIRNCFPTTRAKRSSDSKVIDVLSGSSKRSNCERLVCIFCANAVLVTFVSFIISAI